MHSFCVFGAHIQLLLVVQHSQHLQDIGKLAFSRGFLRGIHKTALLQCSGNLRE